MALYKPPAKQETLRVRLNTDLMERIDWEAESLCLTRSEYVRLQLQAVFSRPTPAQETANQPAI